MKSIIPHQDKVFQNQIKVSEVPEDNYYFLFKPKSFSNFKKAYQFVFFFLTLGPFRVLIALLSFIFVIVGTLFIQLFYEILQFSRSTRNLLCLKISKFGIRILLFCFGLFYMKIDGSPDSQARFLISNYVSWVDCLVILLNNEYGLVIRRNYFKNPLSKFLVSFLDPVYYEDEKHFMKAICERAGDFSKPPILAFPEGYRHRKSSECLFQFDKYPFSTCFVVQPIAIRYTMWLVPDGWNTYGFMDDNLIYSFFRLFSIPPSMVTLSFLPSKSMQNDGKANIKTFTEAVQISLANFIGICAVKPQAVDN